ncbi:hypothetical protein [Campylobacter mucosalis]|uniref:Putative membrane protein n=1 Tax=Campylobacter mucosalis CCUG 21559 TaxID=1032067 RepID=A0A6G5QF06_9BACT|nr:hypothetical protein [Campylobacter mucosalis]QCD44204.1 putative membrane protein [Campylobacter mucosalis CCUG 21559]
MTKALHEEIIDEIGTQTLARFGLNIFSLNTYEGYAASVTATNITKYRAYQHEKNDKSYGYNFENLDVGQANIKNALYQNQNAVYTTDNIADIQKVSDIIKSGKKYENLSDKDRQKFDFVMRNFSNELEKIQNGSLDFSNFIKNDPNTDVVTLNSQGEVIKKEQHKVIKNTIDLLKDRYLKNNDNFKVPFDDYVRHKNELEKMSNDPNLDQDTKQKAIKALEMLDKNNVTNRLMCENPKTTAIMTQSAVAAGHIAQAGMSDAIVVCLSTLANGAIYEIKDALSSNGENIGLFERVKRLLQKVFESFKGTFMRGAGFGFIDVIMQTLGQIFKDMSKNLERLWKELRSSAKSIYNGICDYVSGKVKNFSELMILIAKSLFSATMVAFSVILETKISTWLTGILAMPTLVSVLSAALTIVISAIFIVLGTKTIEKSLGYLFGVYAELTKSREKRAEISVLIDEVLPDLMSDNEKIRQMIDEKISQMNIQLQGSFDSLQEAFMANNHTLFIDSLVEVNAIFGKKLKYVNFNEFNDAMISDEPMRF